ncbi:MAG: hypothetical protein P4L72_14825 [Parvibaculum sp.]|uniref:hypothetical protein n=1 Tax=Parvibaculum sp. TaxID=2024848 RepID=UPI0028522B4A|nr:hypothetical protein [Parvibaculum sp.]MDR3500486.1 hypothetical protein [Parvibaculum sp.]
MTDHIRLVVATPCFGGQVSSLYAGSIFKLQRALRAMPEIELVVVMVEGDALITRARANLVAQFLDDPLATHLLFIDADIGFEPDQVMRLLGCGADVSAGVYPIKKVNWEKVQNVLDAGRTNPGSASLDYVLEVEDPARVVVQAGFARVRYAGTGFLMIQRHVLERMCAAHPELRFSRQHCANDTLAGSPNRVALFECLIDKETGIYLSEDFAFCKRWRDLGGEIWADIQSRLDHVGPATFHGDVSTQFGEAPAANVAA